MDAARKAGRLPAFLKWLDLGALALKTRPLLELSITGPTDLGPASRVTQGKPGRLFETISGFTQI